MYTHASAASSAKKPVHEAPAKGYQQSARQYSSCTDGTHASDATTIHQMKCAAAQCVHQSHCSWYIHTTQHDSVAGMWNFICCAAPAV